MPVLRSVTRICALNANDIANDIANDLLSDERNNLTVDQLKFVKSSSTISTIETDRINFLSREILIYKEKMKTLVIVGDHPRNLGLLEKLLNNNEIDICGLILFKREKMIPEPSPNLTLKLKKLWKIHFEK